MAPLERILKTPFYSRRGNFTTFAPILLMFRITFMSNQSFYLYNTHVCLRIYTICFPILITFKLFNPGKSQMSSRIKKNSNSHIIRMKTEIRSTCNCWLSIFNCCQLKLISHTCNGQRWSGCELDVARHWPPQSSPAKGLVILAQRHPRTRTCTEIVSQSFPHLTTIIKDIILICVFCPAVHLILL